MAAPLRRCYAQIKVEKLTKIAYAERNICISAQTQTSEKKSNLHINSAPPEDVCRDWIGPPDKISNIRSIKCYQPDDETTIERDYRLQKVAVQQWHHDFWSKHNKNFFAIKEEFVKERLAEKEKAGLYDQTISAGEMSEFYKKFLDDNYSTHWTYNKEWYKKNVQMLLPAFKVNIIRLFKRRTVSK